MKKYSRLQKLAWFYSFLFFGVVAMNALPFIHDENGLMFGLFKLDPIDDGLHLASALWALSAGLYSRGATIFYFKWYGLAYCLDGVMGLLIGKGYLDLGVFFQEVAVSGWLTRLEVNIPHLILGGSAALLGFYFSRTKMFRA